MTQQKSKKIAANNCEEIFDEYISGFGGEIVHALFNNKENRPSNADYLLFDRTVVAELKCLNEDYFSSKKIGEKSAALLNKLLSEGEITKYFTTGNTINIPDYLAHQFCEIFLNSLKTAVESANKQIKKTKKYFDIPNAKGLIIIVNENNKSLSPEMAMMLLSKLFKTYYSSINSFIYLVPIMDVHAPDIETPSRVWISGPTKDAATGIDSESMKLLNRNWIKFLEIKYKYEINVSHSQDHSILHKLKFNET